MKPCHFFICSKKSEDNSLIVNALKKKLIIHDFIYDDKNPELIIVLGGDGSLMRAIHDLHFPLTTKTKFVLFNTGHLGFFSDYGRGEEEKFANSLLSKEPIVEQLPLFSFIVDDNEEHHFINDIAIQTGQTVFMDVYVNDELLTDSRNNGIVVSTPVGSSGYSLSLNSPVSIYAPNVYQYSLLSPCHNRLFTNTITKAIIGGDQILKVVIEYGKFDVYIDGRHKSKLKGHTFTFSHNKDNYINLLHFENISIVSRLRKNISGKDE